jgi:hypothetical protein
VSQVAAMRDLLAWANSFYTPMEYQIQTVVETSAFLASANGLGLTEAERGEIVGWLAANPESGNVIEGTGGAQGSVFREGQGKERRIPSDHILYRTENPVVSPRNLCEE